MNRTGRQKQRGSCSGSSHEGVTALEEEQTKEARGGTVEDIGTVDMTVMRGEWSTVQCGDCPAEARPWYRGARPTVTFPAPLAPRTTSRDLRLRSPPNPAAGNFCRPLLAWSLTPELCVYTVKRIESHIIIYVTEASAISNINEDK